MRLLRSLLPGTRCIHTTAPRSGPGITFPSASLPEHRRTGILSTLRQTLDKAAASPPPAADGADEAADLRNSQIRFTHGEIYSPYTLSLEAFNVRKHARQRARFDAFDALGIDPRKEYKNYNLLSEYVTEMGRIEHRSRTGCRGVNQRRIAKAIRRAVGIGLLPSTHLHPEILKEKENRFTQRRRR